MSYRLKRMQNPGMVHRAAFDIYGYRFALRSDSEQPFDGLCQDFAFFRSDAREGDRPIELLLEDPQYDRMPDSDASAYTPRNIVYKAGHIRYVDYHGRGVGEHDRRTGGFRIRSLDTDILYEAVYLFLLSQCGEFLDTQGMHRVHALGLSISGRAVLVLLPMGGGKSTLGHDLLQYPEVGLLSDDSPLIDRTGKVHAFPLRLGLLPGHEPDIPKEHTRTINRMEFGPKVLINFEHFADRVSRCANPGLVFLGERSLARGCRIERAGFKAGIRGMVKNCVVGLGLFQGVEFVLNRGSGALISLAGAGMSRLQSSIELLRRSEVHRVWLGQNREVNARTVLETSNCLLKRS